jgi:hypothetical protein
MNPAADVLFGARNDDHHLLSRCFWLIFPLCREEKKKKAILLLLSCRLA